MMNEKMKDLIVNYITGDECSYNNDGKMYDCEYCNNLEECYAVSCIRCNSEFAESINYVGYDSEEEFWEQLMG